MVGATDNHVDSTDRSYEVMLRIDPDGWHSRIYVKHSTAGAVAFERSLWSPDSMLPTFDLAGVRAGATICHDLYLGLLPRFLASCGARIWINPSYDNVVDVKWSSILRLRAVENRVFSLCTLHDSRRRPPELTLLCFLLMEENCQPDKRVSKTRDLFRSAKSRRLYTSSNSICGCLTENWSGTGFHEPMIVENKATT